MWELLFWMVWLGVGMLVFPIASRFVYAHEKDKYKSPLHAYSDSLAIGAGIGLFWPIALPVAFFLFTGGAVARATAPPEVKRLITHHNTLMLERGLGMKQDNELEGS